MLNQMEVMESPTKSIAKDSEAWHEHSTVLSLSTSAMTFYHGKGKYELTLGTGFNLCESY